MERFQPAPTAVEYLQQANDTLVTMVQIETQDALNNIDAIAATDGIDVLFVGPFDLGSFPFDRVDVIVFNDLADAKL